LTLDPDIVAKLKAEGRKTGLSFKKLVNTLLRLGLNSRQSRRAPKPFIVKARPLGVRPGLPYDNIGELLEHTEGPSHP